jgi:integrase
MLEADRAEEILSYLFRFDYASRKHLVLEILWRTGMRTGALHSLDVADVDAEQQALQARHRPAGGTSLKNGNRGERLVAISEETRTIVQDRIDHNRPEVTDENGRHPLVATQHGRIVKGNIRHIVYRITRPCGIEGECPCGKKGEFPSKYCRLSPCGSIAYRFSICESSATTPRASLIDKRVIHLPPRTTPDSHTGL